jgi:hypothetical protein
MCPEWKPPLQPSVRLPFSLSSGSARTLKLAGMFARESRFPSSGQLVTASADLEIPLPVFPRLPGTWERAWASIANLTIPVNNTPTALQLHLVDTW